MEQEEFNPAAGLVTEQHDPTKRSGLRRPQKTVMREPATVPPRIPLKRHHKQPSAHSRPPVRSRPEKLRLRGTPPTVIDDDSSSPIFKTAVAGTSPRPEGNPFTKPVLGSQSRLPARTKIDPKLRSQNTGGRGKQRAGALSTSAEYEEELTEDTRPPQVMPPPDFPPHQ